MRVMNINVYTTLDLCILIIYQGCYIGGVWIVDHALWTYIGRQDNLFCFGRVEKNYGFDTCIVNMFKYYENML